MLTRVLEPELMESVSEAEAYNDMDHADVDQRFIDDLLAAAAARGSESPAGPILAVDLGAGTALQPILFSRQSADVEVVAIDAARAMLRVAQRNLQVAGDERIHLLRADAKCVPFAANAFEIVFSNSLIHHLAHPLTAMREACRIVAPGGLIFFRDLLRPPTIQDLEMLVTKYVAAADETGRRLFADSLRAALTEEEVVACVSGLSGVRSTVAVTSDRHWTWTATKSA